jgi:hypothetical protein
MGDAAHQMPPFLGQGMCSGIRDAVNLAWKLDDALSGVQPEELLDTYESERSPHARSIIGSAVEVGKFVTLADPEAVRARNAQLRDGSDAQVPRFRIPDLLPGPLVRSGGGGAFPQPVNPISGKPTLDDVLGDHMVVLIDGAPPKPEETEWWRTKWGAVVGSVSDLGEDAAAVGEWFRKREITVAVIRPDKCLLATGTSLAAITRDARDALSILELEPQPTAD